MSYLWSIWSRIWSSSQLMVYLHQNLYCPSSTLFIHKIAQIKGRFSLCIFENQIRQKRIGNLFIQSKIKKISTLSLQLESTLQKYSPNIITSIIVCFQSFANFLSLKIKVSQQLQYIQLEKATTMVLSEQQTEEFINRKMINYQGKQSLSPYDVQDIMNCYLKECGENKAVDIQNAALFMENHRSNKFEPFERFHLRKLLFWVRKDLSDTKQRLEASNFNTICQKAFQAFDSNHSGSLSLNEVTDLIQSYFRDVNCRCPYSQKDIAAVMNVLDINKNGLIDKSQMPALLRTLKECPLYGTEYGVIYH